MAWIESHQEIAQHPKTKRFARYLGVSIPDAIGRLHLLWWWAMNYAEDGDLSGFEAADLSDATLWEGDPDELRGALVRAGFIDEDGQIHDWQTYAGRLIERRRQDAERKRTSRAPSIDRGRMSAGHPADIPSPSGVTLPYPTGPDRTGPSEANASGGQPAETIDPPTFDPSPSAPPPKPIPTGRVKPAPKPEPRRDRFAETLDAIKALDPEIVIAGNDGRNAKAVNETKAEPALIAEAYVALMRGEWQDPIVARQGSLHAVVDNIGGYVNGKRRPPPNRTGPARASPPLSALATLGADDDYFTRDWDKELGGSHGSGTNGTIKPD